MTTCLIMYIITAATCIYQLYQVKLGCSRWVVGSPTVESAVVVGMDGLLWDYWP